MVGSKQKSVEAENSKAIKYAATLFQSLTLPTFPWSVAHVKKCKNEGNL